MAYRLKLQLRDSFKDFATTVAREKAYDKAKIALLALGIPEENIVLTRSETLYVPFIGADVEKVTE